MQRNRLNERTTLQAANARRPAIQRQKDYSHPDAPLKARLIRIERVLEAAHYARTGPLGSHQPFDLVTTVCNILRGEGGYVGVWAYLFRSASCTDNTTARINVQVRQTTERPTSFPRCAPRALETGALTVAPHIQSICQSCPFTKECNGTKRLVFGLAGIHTDHGILSVGVPRTASTNTAEEEALAGLAHTLSIRLDALEEMHNIRQTHQWSSQLYHTVFENTGTAMLIVDGTGLITSVNRRFESLTGYSREETEGRMNWEQFFQEEDLPLMREIRRKRLAEEPDAPENYEVCLICKDGTRRPVLKTSTLIPHTQSIVTSMMDISQRKHAEEEIVRLSEFLTSIIEKVNVLIMVTTLEGNVRMWNTTAELTTGYCRSHIVGDTDVWSILQISPEDRMSLRNALNEAKADIPTQDIVTPIRTADGQERTISWHVTTLLNQHSYPTEYLWLGRDITQERQALAAQQEAEQRAQQNQRLAAVGQMAAGVAHEINNPVTGIIGFADLLLQLELDDDARQYTQMILQAGHRVAAIVGQLLAFARLKPAAREPVNLNDIVRQTLQIRAVHLSNAGVSVHTDLEDPMPPICGDAGQLQQVILNIIVNAETEIRLAGHGGKLKIQSRILGDKAVLTFIDDGPGIPEANLARIFEPFFTTRDVGQGTGLGLSICHKLVSEHGGHISACNNDGGGACFTVELPLKRPSSRAS